MFQNFISFQSIKWQFLHIATECSKKLVFSRIFIFLQHLFCQYWSTIVRSENCQNKLLSFMQGMCCSEHTQFPEHPVSTYLFKRIVYFQVLIFSKTEQKILFFLLTRLCQHPQLKSNYVNYCRDKQWKGTENVISGQGAV